MNSESWQYNGSHEMSDTEFRASRLALIGELTITPDKGVKAEDEDTIMKCVRLAIYSLQEEGGSEKLAIKTAEEVLTNLCDNGSISEAEYWFIKEYMYEQIHEYREQE